MKNKLLVVLLIVNSIMLTTFVGCDTACEHNIVVDKAVESTCAKEGLSQGSHCSICGEILVPQEKTPKAEHLAVKVEATEPTCTSPGYSEGSKCSECGELLSGCEETSPAIGHAEETIPGYEATCESSGKTDGSSCSVCGKVLKKQETIPQKGHLVETGKCSACGEYVGDAYMLDYYVDEFGDQTDVPYIRNLYYFGGTYFYGSSDHSLSVLILVDDHVAFKLYEYSDDLANWYGTHTFDVIVKAQDGKKHNMTAKFYKGGDRIILDEKHVDTFIDMLCGSGYISVYIEIDEFNQAYLFDLPTSDFAVEYGKAF